MQTLDIASYIRGEDDIFGPPKNELKNKHFHRNIF